jgi:WD40 repeat protein
LQLTIQPEDLLPQLPNPKDLQPFPSVMSMVYEGHTDMVRSIAVEPKGQYLVSGSDDLTVKGKISVNQLSSLHISVLGMRLGITGLNQARLLLFAKFYLYEAVQE